jgi:zinc transporter ZupT
MIVEIILAYALAVGGGFLGATLAHSHERLCALISLAAGTLLGVVVFGILPEGYEALRWWELLIAFGSGYGLFFLITKHVYHVCPACAASHFDEAMTHRFGEIAMAMMIALAIHCTVDGLAIAAGQEAHEMRQGGRIVSISVVLAICVHKVPEGLALGALLLGAGLSRGPIIFRVMAVEATTLLGGILGLIVLRHVSQFWVSAALVHAAGGFLYLAAHALLGEMMKHDKRIVLTNFIAGIALIALLVLLLHLF